MNTLGKAASVSAGIVFAVCVGYSAGKHETLAHMNHHDNHHHDVSSHGKGHGDMHKTFEAACAAPEHKAACAEVLNAIGHDKLKADHDAMIPRHGEGHSHSGIHHD